MMKMIVDFWIRPSFRNYDWVNIVFYCTILCLGAFLGSFVSVFVISGAVYGSLHLVTGRLNWALPAPVKLVYLSFCGFFAADLIAAAFHPSWIAFGEVVENLPFLGFAAIYSITFVDRERLLSAVEITAAAASFVAAAVTPFVGLLIAADENLQYYRPELAAGNPNVLALLGGILLVLNIGAVVRRWNSGFWIHLAAAACAFYLVSATGTRGLWPILFAIPLLGLCFLPVKKHILWGLPIAALLLLGLFALVATYSDSIKHRIETVGIDIHSIYSGELTSSIGQRVQIYKAGLELFVEKPLLGYGPGNERQEIGRKTLETGGVAVSFSHSHNAFLNAALRAGIVGVVALAGVLVVPLVIGLRAKKDDVGRAGFFTLCGILLVYSCSGIVGLMLGNDIHDAVYIAAVCYALYLVFGRAEAAIP